MKRKAALRGFLGFPIGIAIGYSITILISLVWGKGYYAPCVPELISSMGSEISAVVFQALLCGVLGAGFGAGSVIWEIEEWSIMKQTGIYFAVVSVIMLPIAYVSYWMEHTIAGFLSYLGIFALIFAFVWMVQFMIGKHNVRKMNENLHNVTGWKDQ